MVHSATAPWAFGGVSFNTSIGWNCPRFSAFADGVGPRRSFVTVDAFDKGKKARALIVRHKKTKDWAPFNNAIEEEPITLFKAHFDVKLIDQDFDYGHVCDFYNPDLVIYTTPGGNRPVPLKITNIRARQDIPRVGFTILDPHDTSRVLLLQQMDELLIDRFFACNVATLRQSPELAGRGFVLPLYFNSKIFRDYQLEKIIPVSVFGGMMSPGFYKWRAEQGREIFNHIPTLFYTHPGYESPILAHRYPIAGEDYAKMINRSHFSLSDANRLDYIVRKHLEIPGSGTILISPNTPEVAAYGFVDMENCVLGSGKELLEKIAYVAANPDVYLKICRSGHDLVHSRYTLEHWTGIADWYACHKSLRSGETVQQQGAFGPFVAVPQRENVSALHGELHGNDLTVLMETALENILRGENFKETEESLLSVLDWVGHIGEPWVPLGLVQLLRGDLSKAISLFSMAYIIREKRDTISDLDPEEVAWLSLAGAMAGNQALLDMTRGKSAEMRHVSIRRMQWLGVVLASGGDASSPPDDVLARMPGDRLSIHWLGQVDLKDWLGLVDRVLTANGRGEVLKKLPDFCVREKSSLSPQ